MIPRSGSARGRGALLRLAVLMALVAAMTLGWAVQAWAATTFGTGSPAVVSPATRLDGVRLSIGFQDPASITAATLTLDGVAKTPYLAFAGTWVGDGCDTWFVPDPTQGNVVYTVPVLPVGTHSVTVTLTNGSGVKTSSSWTVDVQPPLTSFSAFTPAASTADWDAQISAIVNDPAGLGSTADVVVDGVSHPVEVLFAFHAGWMSYSEWEALSYTGYMSPLDMTRAFVDWTPASLADGTHDVTVRVTNSTGRTASSTWHFTVAAPPRISALTPPDGTRVSDASGGITAKILDNGVLSSTEMLVDGAPVAATYNKTTNLLTYSPASPLANDATHTVQVTAIDAGGLRSSASWSFRVQTFPDMPQPGTCTDCHDATKHPMNNCAACHNVVYIGHGHGGPISWCLTCHRTSGHGPEVIIPGVTWGGGDEPQPGYTGYWGYYCDHCHDPKYPSIPQHAPDLGDFHNSSMDMSACSPCHVRSLTVEHYRYKDASGVSLNCDTCHGASAPAKVKTAIASHLTSCDACHEFTSGSAHEALHTPAGLDQNCVTCHKDSLTQEHMNNPVTQTKSLGCVTCHSSADGQVTWAIFAGDKTCSACHRSAHGMSLVPAPTGVPLFAGFVFSPPADASLFAGEAWLPPSLVARSKVIVSDRRTDVTGDAVWLYYRDTLAGQGWATTANVSPGSSWFSASFTKGSHVIDVLYYGGETFGDGPVLATGHRIKLIYR